MAAADQNIILGLKAQDQGAIALLQAAQKEMADMGAEQKRLTDQIKQYDRIAQKANKATRNSNGNYKEANKGSRMARGGIAQLGYQLQDISVQVQGGQNLGLILGQQGSQIASVFGTGGIVAGAIIAFGAMVATMMIPKLFESKKGVEDLDEIFQQLNNTMLTVNSDGIFTLSKSFESLAKTNRAYAEIVLRTQMLSAMEAVQIAQKGLSEEADVFKNALSGIFTITAKLDNKYKDLAAEYGIQVSQLKELRYTAILAKNGIEGSAQALVTLLSSIAQTENVTPKFVEIAAAIGEFAQQSTDAKAIVDSITNIMGDLDGALETNTSSYEKTRDAIAKTIEAMNLQVATYGRSSTIIAMYEAVLAGATAEELLQVEALGLKIEALKAADEAEKLAAKKAEDRLKSDEKARAAFYATQNEMRVNAAVQRQKVEDEENKRLEAGQKYAFDILIQKSSAESQYLAQYDQQLSNLQDLRARDLENAGLYNEAIIALENDKQAQMKSYQQQEQDRVMAGINFIGQSASAMESAFEEGSKAQKAAFLVNQGIQVANAIVNTNAAATAALGMPPFTPANIALSGMVKAMGYASAAAIAGQAIGSFEGGGFTGMGSRTGGVDGKGGFAAILHPNETVIDHTKGGGAMSVTVNINAVDTKGFDELLYKRRGQLVSIINQAVNNRGRASIV
jgi:hypothetical protein